MCGFAGFLGSGMMSAAADRDALQCMTDALAHRGPDDAGYWCDSGRQIGFGHRRLAVVDVSPAGHQPMQSASRRYVIAFNGEIYNHLLLRQALQETGLAPAWRGHSDTETLLAAFDAWGVSYALERAAGMFAFALWDRETAELTLARDRIGEKPLYYGWQRRAGHEAFLFGSELKALRAHPAFAGDIDRDALCLQLRHNYIPAPHSIYRGIAKLPPGCLLTVSLARPEPKLRTYWSCARIARAGAAHPYEGNADDAVNELETLLADAVRKQMAADVPLGAFLSGGVDSSVVTALMQSQSARPVRTFTIGFSEQDYNEARHAKAVARYLGTDHTELYVTPQQALAVIPRLPSLYDEPFSDQSQIPTFLVSELARRQVTVALSGDGGDELFCGYDRYRTAAGLRKLWDRIALAPLPLRRLAAGGLAGVSPQSWNRLAGAVEGWLPRSMRTGNIGHKLHKGAELLACSSRDALYRSLMSHWHDPAALVIDGHESSTVLHGATPDLRGLDEMQRMMALDMMSYLPDDILVKLDRAAMGVSLETRVPLLDPRVVEFAWRLPQSVKLRDGRTKWVLRQVLYRHVPRHLIERPKMGFAVPIGHWLRGPLRDWAEALLDASRLRHEGFFHAERISSKWHEHVSGVHNWEYHLWDVLMFQAWAENHRIGAAPEFSRAEVSGSMSQAC